MMNSRLHCSHLGFSTKKKFRNHMRTHDPKLIQICVKCGKSFKNKANAQKHERNAHSNYKPEPQQCSICNTWYTTIANLRRHMRNIHDSTGQEHRCNVCDHVSTTPVALKRHIYLNHTCKDKYRCNRCEKTFNRSLYLKEHMATHTGEALYACPHCPTTFSHNANWYKHFQNVHKAEYAAFKQQDTPANVLKIAKLASEKIHSKRELKDTSTSRSNEGLVISSEIVVAAAKNDTSESEGS